MASFPSDADDIRQHEQDNDMIITKIQQRTTADGPMEEASEPDNQPLDSMTGPDKERRGAISGASSGPPNASGDQAMPSGQPGATNAEQSLYQEIEHAVWDMAALENQALAAQNLAIARMHEELANQPAAPFMPHDNVIRQWYQQYTSRPGAPAPLQAPPAPMPRQLHIFQLTPDEMAVIAAMRARYGPPPARAGPRFMISSVTLTETTQAMGNALPSFSTFHHNAPLPLLANSPQGYWDGPIAPLQRIPSPDEIEWLEDAEHGNAQMALEGRESAEWADDEMEEDDDEEEEEE